MDYNRPPWPDTATLLNDVIKKFDEMSKVMDTATMARTPFEIRYFVAGRHVHPMQQFRQLVIELQVAEGAIKSCIIGKKRRQAEYEILQLEIDELEKDPNNKKALLEAQIKKCKQEELELANNQENRALAGKLKEVDTMYNIIMTEFSDWINKSEMEQLKSERDYWIHRLARQTSNEAAAGAVSAGMIEVIRQLPESDKRDLMNTALIEDNLWNKWMATQRHNALTDCAKLEGPHLPYRHIEGSQPLMKLRKDAPIGYPEDLIVDTERIDIIIGILHRDINKDLPVTTSIDTPTGKNWKLIRLQCPRPELIGEYKNTLALHAESLGATHLFILDDDIAAPASVLRRLYNHNLDIVGAWYPKKVDPPESSTMTLGSDGTAEPVKSGDGLIQVTWSLAAGCTLYKLEALKKLPRPWFKTTEKGTEDTWITRLALQHGIKSHLDRDLKVRHIDVNTNKAYDII